MPPLEITANGQKVATLRLEATIGRAHLARVHTDAKFLNHEQFRLRPEADGWCICPVNGVVNPTLVNGRPLTRAQPVLDGTTVTVRGATGLTILLTCARTDQVSEVDTAAPATKAAATPAREATRSVPAPDARVEAPVAPRSAASGPTLLKRVGAKFKTGWAWLVNWFRAGGAKRIALGAATVFGVIFAAVLAAARSGSSSGSGARIRIREGDSSFGRILLTMEGDRVRRGDTTLGEVIMRLDGQRIRQGDSTIGRILANVDGDRVREGDSSYGRILAKIDGNKIREGDSSYGRILATTEGGRMSAAVAAVYLLRT